MKSPEANIAVIIRTYSRIMDTEALIHLIKTRWTRLSYTIFVAHNGEKDGHHVTDFIKNNAIYVSVDENKGHIAGAKSLVQAGLKTASSLGGFTHYIFIESDFWLLDDSLIENLIKKMTVQNTPIATTIWVENRHSLAVDFFIVKSEFIHEHPELLDWDDHPERYISKILSESDVSVIDELRPVHLPRLLKKINFPATVVDGGRFRIFTHAPAITHHVETLDPSPQKGMVIKKGLANALVEESIFPDAEPVVLPRSLIWQKLSRYVPQSTWYRRLIMNSEVHP